MAGVSRIFTKSALLTTLSQRMSASLVVASTKSLPSLCAMSFATGLMARNVELQMPKRPKTAYFQFMEKHRPAVKASNSNLPLTDISKIVAQKWGETSEEQKQLYKNMWLQEKEVYEQKLAVLKADPKMSEQLEELKKEKSKASAKRAVRKAKVEKNRLMGELGKPSRPPTAYFLFVKDNFEAEKKKHGSGGKGVMTATTKGLSEKWRNLDAKEKERYVAKSELLKGEYTANMGEWKLKMQEDLEKSGNITDIKKKLSQARKRAHANA